MIMFDLDFQRYSSSLYCNKQYLETHQEDTAQLAITSILSSVETHHYIMNIMVCTLCCCSYRCSGN